MAENIANAINEHFLDKNTCTYDTGSQSSYALPLFLGIVPVHYRAQVLNNLIQKIVASDYHITTGEYGMRPLLNVLSETGHCDMVYKMLTNDTPPSYKHFLNLGKTSLPETWSGEYSQNHCILGHGDGWLYEYLAGIQNAGIAFDRIIIEPYFPEDIEWLSVELETPKGPVTEHWEQNEGLYSLTVTIPVNSTATIILPTEKILSGDTPANVTINIENHKTVLEVASGKYHFTFRK